MLKTVTNIVNVSQITGVLPVVNGGTGVTTSTGTGSVVLSAAPTLSGNVALSTGSLVISTSGQGIDFSATSHPAGMTSELFNDYEEGTWTPVVSDAITGGNLASLSASAGKYTKIGRQVTISCRIVFSSKAGMTAGNTAYIQGLPFTPGNAAADRYTGSTLLENITFTNTPSFVIDGNGSVFYMYQNLSGLGGAAITVLQTANNSFIAGSITYFV
jgi:hypothetical protein